MILLNKAAYLDISHNKYIDSIVRHSRICESGNYCFHIFCAKNFSYTIQSTISVNFHCRSNCNRPADLAIVFGGGYLETFV